MILDESLEPFDELSFYTLAHPDPAFIHQHIVDASIAQTANEDTKPIAVAFSLIGLCLYLEKKLHWQTSAVGSYGAGASQARVAEVRFTRVAGRDHDCGRVK
jgi:hypothetical protein